jgi:hypothetical protein
MRNLTVILTIALIGCAADKYHADPVNPPRESVYDANRTCAWSSVRIGEVNPAGVAGIAGGALGGAIGGGAAGTIVGAAAPTPHLARWDACMAQHGWLTN